MEHLGNRRVLDANNEEVDCNDIEVYEPQDAGAETPGENEAADAGTASGNDVRDPAARAGNTAARAVERIVAEVDEYRNDVAAAANGAGKHDHAAADKVLDDFVTNISVGVAQVDITGSLSGPTVLQNAPALAKHANQAVIRLKGTDTVRIQCFRTKNRFRVNRVTATESGDESRVGPNAASIDQLDLYANLILHAWGL